MQGAAGRGVAGPACCAVADRAPGRGLTEETPDHGRLATLGVLGKGALWGHIIVGGESLLRAWSPEPALMRPGGGLAGRTAHS